MMNNKHIASFVAALFLTPFVTFAMGAGFEMGSSIYLFYFTQKNGTLYQSSSPGYDIIQDEYVETMKTGEGTYYLEIVNMGGKVVSRVDFAGALKSGSSLAIRAPYFADAKTANIHDLSGKKILSVDLSGSSICNGNNKCDIQFGESVSTCPAECGGGAAMPAVAPETPPAQVEPVIIEPVAPNPTFPDVPVSMPVANESGSTNLPKTALLVIGGALLLAGVSFILLKKQGQAGGG